MDQLRRAAEFRFHGQCRRPISSSGYPLATRLGYVRTGADDIPLAHADEVIE
jgi:hypothetical protein